jgi:hypothetical protein
MQSTVPSSKKSKVLLGLGVALLVLVIVAAGVRALYVRHFMKLPGSELLLQPQHPLAPEDIQGWMTFEYINFVFKLPPEYLKQTLSVEGNQYPKVALKRYANKAGLDTGAFIRKVEEAVRNYKP